MGKGIRQFLPEFNLPPELENDPWTEEPQDSLKTARFLFLMASMERRSQSNQNIKNALKTWENPRLRWIFDQGEVARREPDEVFEVCKNSLKYTLSKFPLNYHFNSKVISSAYGNDPRKLIEGKTVSKAKSEIESFKGIGTGISNLFIHYYLNRRIAFPSDPENALLKVDIHKTRIPLNTDCVYIDQVSIRRDSLVQDLEIAYLDICLGTGINASLLDSILWVIGSEGCSRKDYRHCNAHCPLVEKCESYVPEDRETGEMLVYTEIDGRKVRSDLRKNRGQESFLKVILPDQFSR
jgi:hypothetical protein